MATQIQQLRKLYRRDKAAQPVLERLAQSQGEEETDVDAIVDATGTPRLDVVRVFKELEESRCGKFIVGRKGGLSRMRWLIEPQALLSAAVGKQENLPVVHNDDVESSGVRTEEVGIPARHAPSDSSITHTYNLRPGLIVRFELPTSLSASEAERLAIFIRSLPFG